MERVNKIINHPLWIDAVSDIENSEKDRKFCRHGREHLLDTARIAYIFSLEENLNISKEMIYAAALLHDIGRSEAYAGGLPHEEAGAALARKILLECDFDHDEVDLIADAILSHREKSALKNDVLSRILYMADKKSRMCLFCDARNECKWDFEKMNMTLDI